MEVIEIFTDGSAKGNPGPGGYGVLLRSGKHYKELSQGFRLTTNNRMELTAVIEGLNSLNRKCRVMVTTDSVYVKDGISSWIHNWKKRNWKTAAKKPVKNQDLWQALDEAAARHDVRWHWVKGHSGHPENERADALANEAIDEMLA